MSLMSKIIKNQQLSNVIYAKDDFVYKKRPPGLLQAVFSGGGKGVYFIILIFITLLNLPFRVLR